MPLQKLKIFAQVYCHKKRRRFNSQRENFNVELSQLGNFVIELERLYLKPWGAFSDERKIKDFNYQRAS